MAVDQENNSVPGKRKYNPEERLQSAATLGRKCIRSIRDGEDLQTAYILLQDSCQQLEKLLADGAQPGLFDDSQTRSRYRAGQYRQWICAQSVGILANQYLAMASCAITLHKPEAFAQYMPRMISYAEQADQTCRTAETWEVLLNNLTAAGEWCLRQLQPADPERAFQYGFRVLKLVEHPGRPVQEREDFAFPLLERAAKTIYDSVALAPALAKGLNEGFAGVFTPAKREGYITRHIHLYADLEADLLDWMWEHGETWRGPWPEANASFETVFVTTVRGLVKAGAMVKNPHFRERVLQVLGKMQDEMQQIDLGKEILLYCDMHQEANELEDTLHLVEDVRKVISRDGRHNCHPSIWLYAQKALSDVLIQSDRFEDAGLIAAETLQDVAELRQRACPGGKWDLSMIRDKGMTLALGHMMNMAESNAYLKRAAASNHLDRPKEALRFMDQAEAVLDRGEETDRLYPLLREQVRQLRLRTMEAYPLEELL